jgi:hypothetical protein
MRRRRPVWSWVGYRFGSQRAFRLAVRRMMRLVRPARQRFDLTEEDRDIHP